MNGTGKVYVLEVERGDEECLLPGASLCVYRHGGAWAACWAVWGLLHPSISSRRVVVSKVKIFTLPFFLFLLSFFNLHKITFRPTSIPALFGGFCLLI